ncbi:hypothetical protein K6U06_05350 [Acidiferrimicrobium sp. IK]|uniref:hypothetical protein n=1 Tax=Acidiferrimicrobium sp. IK TaxID=2871700 RepID=UPI0021CB40A9|nr:hypothetical protein [Acidiferrimicrobium sp. IK]MCU4183777.1 hypothetical protein [Acidiferrimicrobium sp. IK]
MRVEDEVIADAPATASRRRAAAPGVAIAASYLGLAAVAFWHIVTHPTTIAMSSGAGDSATFAWQLAYVPWAIAHGHDPFVATVANYPAGLNLLDNTSLPLLGLIGSPVTALWGPVATLNLWWVLAFPLSAAAAYLLARRFTTSRSIAWFAGLLYGFGPYQVAQGAGHLNLAFVPVPPLVMLLLYDLLVAPVRGQPTRSPRSIGARLAVLVIVQFFISSEILATTAVFAALAVVVVALANRSEVRGGARRVAEAVPVTAGIAAVVLAWPLYVALAGPAHVRGTIFGYRYYFSAVFGPVLPSSLFVVATRHLHSLGDRIGGNPVENGTYLGVFLVVLLVVAPFVARRRRLTVAVVLAAASFVLSLGVSLHFGVSRFARYDAKIPLPAAVLYKTPIVNQAFPVRYSLYVDLFASVAVAIVLDLLRRDRAPGPPRAGGHRQHRRLPPARRLAVLPIVVAALVAVPLIPAWPYNSQGRVAVPSFFTSSALDQVPEGSVALVYPIATNTLSNAEVWQATARFRFAMPGGYFVLPAGSGRGSVYTADTLVERTLSGVVAGPNPSRSATLRRELRAQLGSWHVRTVLAQPVGTDPVGFFTWLVGRPPGSCTGGMCVWPRVSWSG